MPAFYRILDRQDDDPGQEPGHPALFLVGEDTAIRALQLPITGDLRTADVPHAAVVRHTQAPAIATTVIPILVGGCPALSPLRLAATTITTAPEVVRPGISTVPHSRPVQHRILSVCPATGTARALRRGLGSESCIYLPGRMEQRENMPFGFERTSWTLPVRINAVTKPLLHPRRCRRAVGGCLLLQ